MTFDIFLLMLAIVGGTCLTFATIEIYFGCIRSSHFDKMYAAKLKRDMER